MGMSWPAPFDPFREQSATRLGWRLDLRGRKQDLWSERDVGESKSLLGRSRDRAGVREMREFEVAAIDETERNRDEWVQNRWFNLVNYFSLVFLLSKALKEIKKQKQKLAHVHVASSGSLQIGFFNFVN